VNSCFDGTRGAMREVSGRDPPGMDVESNPERDRRDGPGKRRTRGLTLNESLACRAYHRSPQAELLASLSYLIDSNCPACVRSTALGLCLLLFPSLLNLSLPPSPRPPPGGDPTRPSSYWTKWIASTFPTSPSAPISSCYRSTRPRDTSLAALPARLRALHGSLSATARSGTPRWSYGRSSRG
jgi:hypothetical protein